MQRQGYKSYLVASGIALLCSLVVVATVNKLEAVFVDWENKTVDYRFKLRGDIPVAPDIVLIDIDDKSIGAIGRWPWDRTYHARMIEIISRNGASAIGYDILFNQPADGTQDDALAKAIQGAGNVYLPVGFELEKLDTGLLTVKREIGPIPQIRKAAAGLGHISSNRDPDGMVRRIPMAVDFDGKLFPAFSLAVLAGHFKTSPERIDVEPSSYVTLQGAFMPSRNEGGDLRIPVDASAMMLVNYAGRWVETFDHYSFIDILEAWDTEAGRKPLREILKGKISLVSNTATGYDLKPIPFEADYPGGGIHANGINTILTGRYLRQVDGFAFLGLIFLLSLTTACLTVQTRWWLGLASSSLIALGYVSLTVYVFNKGFVLQVLPPVLTITLTYVSILLYQNHLSRDYMEALVREKDLIGESLHKVADALQANETHLNQDRAALSHLMREIQEVRGQEKEKLGRIKDLEVILESATFERDDLLKKKRVLEEKVADLLIAPTQQHKPANDELEALRRECARHGIISQNKRMLQVFGRAKKVAVTKNPVLIQGETGTGKELFAWAIHKMSPRSGMSFSTINIPALQDNLIESELFGHRKGSFTSAVSDRKGKFQLADGGTIFLDEIGEMKLELQAKLLRVIENGQVDPVGAGNPVQVDVRIIAATNRDLEEEVRCGRFREDLYYRLSVVPVAILPLRDRRDDIETLANYFAAKVSLEAGQKGKGISLKAMERLKGHAWKGNVRELEHAIARGMTMAEGNSISEADLELSERAIPTGNEDYDPGVIAVGEKEPLSDADFLTKLRSNRFDIGKTAQQLDLTRNTVGSRLKGISFNVLVEKDGDFKAAARRISGDGNPSELIEEKIQDYYNNLLEFVRGYDRCEQAISECHRRFKNLPQRYFTSLDILIRQYFDQKNDRTRIATGDDATQISTGI